MTVDYSDEIGWPASPTPVVRELTQKQKGARALNAFLANREALRLAHPYCKICVCESCKKQRGDAA